MSGETEVLPDPKTHSHNFTEWHRMDKVPTAGGGHTSFMLIGCGACRAVDVFGGENFALVEPEAAEAIREQIRKGGGTPLF